MEALDTKGNPDTPPKDEDKFIKKMARTGTLTVEELYKSCGGTEEGTLPRKVEWVFQRLVSGHLVPI